ncbi:MAG: hypothetical protein S4CHLAM6_12380 [Chlamydiae bacterium]|nr:hypothetical protein [Chlamydiota bacterium]
MTSVDNFNIDAHSRYAIDKARIESFNSDHHISNPMDTRIVSDHAQVLDHNPKPSAFVDLFGVNLKRRWAYFEKPASFAQNRVFFFGADSAIEKSEVASNRVASIDCRDADPKEQALRLKERDLIENFCKQVTGLHEDYQHIMGCIHKFLQA